MNTDRPILMSGPMVRAILDGRKTQTRRVVKPQPDAEFTVAMLDDWERDSCSSGIESLKFSTPFELFGRWLWWPLGYKKIRCPYGQPGGRLWVRETLRHGSDVWIYEADGAEIGLEPGDPAVPKMMSWAHHMERDVCVSIHMPRWASRIDLEITGVRVERLQDISEADAIAEGIEWVPDNYGNGPAYRDYRVVGREALDTAEWFASPIYSYHSLWDSINGKRKPNKPDVSWAANPWVWVVEFKRVEGRGA